MRIKKLKLHLENISGGFLTHQKKLPDICCLKQNQTVVNAIVNGLFIHSPRWVEVSSADEVFPPATTLTTRSFCLILRELPKKCSCLQFQWNIKKMKFKILPKILPKSLLID